MLLLISEIFFSLQYFIKAPEEFYADENHFTILQSKKVSEIIQHFFEK